MVTSKARGSGVKTSSGSSGAGAGACERTDGGSGKHLAMGCVSTASRKTCGRRKKTTFGMSGSGVVMSMVGSGAQGRVSIINQLLDGRWETHQAQAAGDRGGGVEMTDSCCQVSPG